MVNKRNKNSNDFGHVDTKLGVKGRLTAGVSAVIALISRACVGFVPANVEVSGAERRHSAAERMSAFDSARTLGRSAFRTSSGAVPAVLPSHIPRGICSPARPRRTNIEVVRSS